MGTSIEGVITYGVAFDEGHEFPWECEEYDYDIDYWWADVKNFQATKEVYDQKGNLAPGMTEDDISAYWSEVSAWKSANPVPVDLINVCSGEYPMYILAIPGTTVVADVGNPVEITKDTLRTIRAEEYQKFIEFLEDYVEVDLEKQKCGWFLGSYWG